MTLDPSQKPDCHLVYRPSAPASTSPYRLFDGQGCEVRWANDFLDVRHLRGLSPRSLRAYGYDLLHLARWWSECAGPRPLSKFNETRLLDYVRHQLEQEPKPTPQTINHRLAVLRCLYRFHFHREIPPGPFNLHHAYTPRHPLSYGRPRRGQAAFSLKEPQRVVVPLSPEEVAQFWRSFRTFRDLSLIALMLLDGLRSCEVLHLQLEDLRVAEGQIRVHGKGNRERVLPLPEETLQALQSYLHWERPLINTPALFVCLKGPRRGRPLTLAGLRSLFRHHRLRSRVLQANPHRLRHTFGSDMARAGISLLALMRLMGHAQIHTTLIYAQLSPQDVWREYARAVQRRLQLQPKLLPPGGQP